ncbi:CYTH and CHAD domain-containing protein [Streptomyces sp. LX-29]|uniref:CYTH and CHAD domain-containing protein n=1 Tax=Streptomyces sp. LX-29 TaxID=2900152 RepID=UPI00240D3531|nr:CYTH and CHAD domain-containing protein [Streptomyces sp. LX-29]WFB09594.1 CYTH and CHAD domain-containing protein [Streptomyces sp. LX-29]
MADTVREVERKYDAADAGGLPDLSGVPGVARTVAGGVVTLDATYYDTPDRRLAADGITLRRRTGGDDAGWHLKLPVGPDTRDEIRASLADDLPRRLAALIHSRTRGARVVPLVRLVSEREVHRLLDAEGVPLAEGSVDRVTAYRLADGERAPAHWTEIEVELAEGCDPRLLDAIEKKLRKAGVRRAAASSKLARALHETATEEERKRTAEARRPARPAEPTAGDVVLDYARGQLAAIVTLDPAVRLDTPDSVHRMRVATRRLRSLFRSYAKVLDRGVTDPVGEELKWLAAELGVDRDREVLTERLSRRLDEVPPALRVGPVRNRLHTWSHARRGGSRRQVIALLDGERYLALLNTLDALLAAPPLRPAAARPPRKVLRKAVLRDFARLAGRVETALSAPAGPERDEAVHAARKAAKRTRYAAEAARPALGKPAKRFAQRMTSVQDVLGDHQDSVVARQALTDLSAEAHAAGESAFTYGLVYGREEAVAADRERELPELWAEVSRKKHRAALGA